MKKKRSNAISEVNIEYLHKMVSYCEKKNVKLYLFRSPMHPIMFNIVNEKLFQNIRKEQFGLLPFLDFHDFPLTNDEFGDFDHLNYKGAKKFSEFFNEKYSSR